MCGFVGFLKPKRFSADIGKQYLTRMMNNITHRGPDDSGFWLDERQGIGIGHRRLSILDLTLAGHQPMISSSGRFVIAFNGEIYNHFEIRKKLEKKNINWRGHSDTETLLAGFESWGIKETIETCIGMFAFVIWDTQKNNLTLARDRVGEKPLYYGWQGTGENACFFFGSELKAFKAHPLFSKEIDREAVGRFITYGYVPAPHSIFKGIKKLEPGQMLTVSPMRREPKITTYWSFSDVALASTQNSLMIDENSAIAGLDELLISAVNQQMISDVPVGAFLSGGIDSSTIVSLMQASSSQAVKTFSIGFNEHSYNEADAAKNIANFLGTDHTELYVTPKEALDIIPKLPHIYCEPFADSSQIPTILISALASQNVKVSLSGDGGDEVFGGYNRYTLTNVLWDKISKLPLGLRQFFVSLIYRVSPQTLDLLFKLLQPFLPNSLLLNNFGEKMHKAGRILPSQNLEELYAGLTTSWNPAEIGFSNLNLNDEMSAIISSMHQLNDVEKMMVLDSIKYLPNDILVKLDRGSMSQSLETRAPFLDHRVIEFAWRIPQSLKLKNNTSKWLLREILHKRVPKEIVNRPKMGFGIPIDVWLRGPLKDWAAELLNKSRLQNEGFFDAEIVQKKWKQHLSEERNFQHQLWNVLMFNSWYELE